MIFGRSDLTGWCEKGDHEHCRDLRTATGYHWWCICDCHPEPPHHTNDQRMAHAVWQAQRAQRVTA